MTISKVGAYQDVRTSGTTAGFTETAVAGNIFYGKVRWNAQGSCTITCPGETPVVIQTVQTAASGGYSHCSYYIEFQTGGSKTITANMGEHGGTGHYGQQYNSDVGWNPANIVFGFVGTTESSAAITVPNAPAGALNEGAFSGVSNPVPSPVPPWAQVALQNESYFSEGIQYVNWTGGDATIQNVQGHPSESRYLVNTLEVLQEDSGGPPPIDKAGGVAATWLLGGVQGSPAQDKTAGSSVTWLLGSPAAFTYEQAGGFPVTWVLGEATAVTYEQAGGFPVTWVLGGAVPVEYGQAGGYPVTWLLGGVSNTMGPPQDVEGGPTVIWFPGAVGEITQGAVDKAVGYPVTWLLGGVVPVEYFQLGGYAVGWMLGGVQEEGRAPQDVAGGPSVFWVLNAMVPREKLGAGGFAVAWQPGARSGGGAGAGIGLMKPLLRPRRR